MNTATSTSLLKSLRNNIEQQQLCSVNFLLFKFYFDYLKFYIDYDVKMFHQVEFLVN